MVSNAMREINSKYTIKYCPVCGAVYCYGISQCDNCCNECKAIVIDAGKTLQDYFDELNTEDAGDVQEYIRNKYIYINDNILYNPIKENQRLKGSIATQEAIKKMQKENISQTNNIPHCPTCGSTNVEKISGVNKVGSVAVFGVFSLGHISKTFRCKNCGMKF
jgi:uncharacterized protein (UPF0212 family)